MSEMRVRGGCESRMSDFGTVSKVGSAQLKESVEGMAFER